MAERFRKLFENGSDNSLSPAQKATRFFEIAKEEDYDYHDSLLPHILVLESVTAQPTAANPSHCRIVYSFNVPLKLCNMGGNLHGGAVALIFDICTSTAVSAVSRAGFWDTGHVTRSLNCNYLRPAAEGKKVYVISEVVHLGKRQGLARGEIRLETEDGKIAYTCEHQKAAMGKSSL